MTVAFKEPSSNGRPIRHYAVRVTDKGQEVVLTQVASSPAVLTGLLNGTDYLVALAAVTEIGSSDFGEAQLFNPGAYMRNSHKLRFAAQRAW